MAGTTSGDDPPLSHLDQRGEAHMVEVGPKPETQRRATACGRVEMAPATLARIAAADLPKGEVLQVARLAAIQAVKRTAELIPLCHPLRITGVQVRLSPSPGPPSGPAHIDIEVEVSAYDRTGVEMEALTAVSVAGLTIYDMCKAVDRSMRITAICLLEKRGGRSGLWQRDEDPA